jgi:hypothetical protein
MASKFPYGLNIFRVLRCQITHLAIIRIMAWLARTDTCWASKEKKTIRDVPEAAKSHVQRSGLGQICNVRLGSRVFENLQSDMIDMRSFDKVFNKTCPYHGSSGQIIAHLRQQGGGIVWRRRACWLRRQRRQHLNLLYTLRSLLKVLKNQVFQRERNRRRRESKCEEMRGLK